MPRNFERREGKEHVSESSDSDRSRSSKKDRSRFFDPRNLHGYQTPSETCNSRGEYNITHTVWAGYLDGEAARGWREAGLSPPRRIQEQENQGEARKTQIRDFADHFMTHVGASFESASIRTEMRNNPMDTQEFITFERHV